MRHSTLSLFFVAVLALAVLSACGTLDLSVASTPEPTSAAPVASPETGGEVSGEAGAPATLALERYTSPQIGYSLPVPSGAEVLEEAEGRVVYFTVGSDPSGEPGFIMVVETIVDLPAEAQDSAQAVLEWQLASINGVSPLGLAGSESGSLDRAAASFPGGQAELCSATELVLAAYLVDGVAYLVRLASDGPGRCDAAVLSETAEILSGFVPPSESPSGAVAPPAAVTPENLMVAFVRDGNLYLWDEVQGERQLTVDGGVEQPVISQDGLIIAFRRGNSVWAINADGSGERRLAAEEELTIPDLGQLNSVISGVSPYQMAWAPGTHRLLFNTMPRFEAPGLILSNDLWAVEADSGELRNLFATGDGGDFHISPDGRRVALVQPSNVHVANIDGTDRRHLLAYTSVITFSEFEYYVKPVWAPDSQSLVVVVPPSDRMATETLVYGLWRLPMDGTPARSLGSIETRLGNFNLDPVVAPDHSLVAYLRTPESEANRSELYLAELGESIGRADFYTGSVESFGSWAPNAAHFVFSPSRDDHPALVLGRLGSPSEPLGSNETAAIDLQWAGDGRFVFLQATGSGWDLVLGDLDGGLSVIDSVAGAPPAFDVAG
jgi:hypothetical protein